ncbi:MAG: hypothetical protein A2790_12050 [Phenylobacterium sp. RIFCSPHIGHO2_01_FULL_69_31]|uniref:hypothetical protein n=1 Tax=Phenylobacterium sp. RIFCSPHIGHO2_01_FULL_69_31 TaxID=1801944 RepID=UPI0008B55B0B|nr:hypothetical protein [Phenylobacterium sp. RIFCSPHIGHO2_01_FULL_69_31]OHB28144.1 MAG: hypothetical protein A2790_12050 [Phenylobacterium sp. RIFCSPHIGHO2_01_FULL_69_31]
MTGFLPRGYYPLSEVRAAIGAAKLGSYLASGDLLGFVQVDGEFKQMAAEGWGQEGSDKIVDAGALDLGDGQLLPILVTSSNPKAFAMKMDARPRPGVTLPPAPLKRVNSGGRPVKWDWEGAMVELARLDATDGTANKTQAALVAHLADWFVKNSGHGDAPTVSELKVRVRRFQEALKPET